MTSRRNARQWTHIVMEALAEAKIQRDKIITIHVAKDSSFVAVEHAIMALMADGVEAAFRLDIQKHTLH
mgnify:CR=1 FL=1